VAKHFHTNSIHFISFLVASFAVVRDMHFGPADFILIDIGGEVTEISMVKKNLLRESTSYPLGYNVVIREIAKLFKRNFDEAKSLFALYQSGHIEEKEKQKVEFIIKETKDKWLGQFQSSLANLSHDISVPATLFVTIHPKVAPFFIELIRSEQFNQYTLTQSKFKVILLGPDTLHNSVTFRDSADLDVFLMINSTYINRFLK